MEISVLASGSSGNSTFVAGKENALLIDAGLSAMQIRKKLSSLGRDIQEVGAVIITHEHVDHIKGLERLNDKHDIPVFIKKDAYFASGLRLHNPNFFGSRFSFGEFNINAVPINHDAADPVGFMIQENSKSLGYFTDLGKSNEKMLATVKASDALVIETNHDIDMVLRGNYPYHLKERILGEKGHLSNIDAGLIVQEHGDYNLKNIFLAHLSQNNNTAELAYNTFTSLSSRNKKLTSNVHLASQEIQTELIRL